MNARGILGPAGLTVAMLGVISALVIESTNMGQAWAETGPGWCTNGHVSLKSVRLMHDGAHVRVNARVERLLLAFGDHATVEIHQQGRGGQRVIWIDTAHRASANGHDFVYEALIPTEHFQGELSGSSNIHARFIANGAISDTCAAPFVHAPRSAAFPVPA